MARVFAWIELLSKCCYGLSKYICIFLLLAMGIMMFIEVVLRYFLNAPTMWIESLLKFICIAIAFLSAGMVLTKRGHMIISLVWVKFPTKLAYFFQVIFDVTILAFFLCITYYGVQATLTFPGFLWEFGNLPKRYFFIIIPITGTMISIQALYLVFSDLLEAKKWRKEREKLTGA